MAVITGSFNSLVSGTISGVFQNTAGGVLSGVIGTPGPQGIPGPTGEGVPVGGSAGQALVKIDGTNYNTEWSSLPAFLTKAGNLSGLTDLATARQNLNLGSSDTPVFGGVDAGSGANVAHLSPTALSLTQFGHGQFTIQPSQGIVFPDASVQTTAWNDAPSDGVIYGRQDGSWVNAGGGAGVYLPLAGGSMDLDAQIELSSTGGSYLSFAGSVINLSVGNDDTNIEPGKIQLYFEYVATPLTIDVNGITFPDATVQTTAFTDVYLPLDGGTMTGSIYFTNAVSPIFQINDTSEGGDIPGDENYSAYTLTGLSFRSQNYSDDGEGGVNPPTLTYGSALTGYGLRFVNFNGSSRASTMLYGPTSITFPNSSVQTIAFPGFNNVALTGNPTAPTPATSDNDTSIATTAYVKAQGYLTSAPVTSVAGRTGVITLSNTDISGLGSLAVVNDAPSNGSQYARKNAAWDVVIPGDRYLTTSTTSLTINNANKTLTIGTGLSYTPTQNITISYDAANHMHGEVLTYSTSTGVLTVDIKNHTGSGTYAAWVVNVGGVTPATSVAWGGITGTLSAQTDLQSALDLKSNLASPSFSGTPSLPTGSIGVTQSPGNNTTALATTAFVTAAVPAFATNAQAVAGTSATVSLNPVNGLIAQMNSSAWVGVPASTMAAANLGGGSTTANVAGTIISTGSTAVGYGLRWANAPARGANINGGINWSRPAAISARMGSYFQLQTQAVFRMNLGASTTVLGTPAVRSIGVSFGASATNTCSALVLEVHNGTTLTSVTTSFTPTHTQLFDCAVYSDGTGNVYCYVNGVQVGTSAAGPSTLASTNQNAAQIGMENVTVPTTYSTGAFYNFKFLIS